MLRTLPLCLLLLLAACAGDGPSPTAEPSPAPSPPPTDPVPADVRQVADQVMADLAEKDFKQLARHVHPQQGVTFSPYGYVEPDQHVTLMPEELEPAWESDEVRTWGHQDGSGFPIESTFREYYGDWIYPKPFAEAPEVAVDERLGHGNSLNNIAEVWPGASFVEYHFPGTDPRYGGMDWESLRLVFLRADGGSGEERWWLVGVVHDEWTI